MLALPALAQETPAVPQRETDVIKPQPVCPIPVQLPIVIQAPAYQWIGPILSADGGIFFQQGNKRIQANSIEYNTLTGIGTANRVYFTTCSATRPDYHITASSVTLLPNNRLHARNVALYLGTHKVLILPSIKMRVGGRAPTTSIFPRLGYDKRDGATLTQTLRLVDQLRARTTANIRFTTQHSLEGDINGIYGADGNLSNFPGQFITYGSMRSQTLNFQQPPVGNCDPQLLRPRDIAHLRPFAQLTLRQRTYDAKDLGLVVYRQPEIGATYIGNQLSLTKQRLDPRIELYPEATLTWGRFKEIPGHPDFITRSMISAKGAVNTWWLGPTTTIQPIGIGTYAAYGNGDVFRTWGYGLDISHLTRNSSFYSVRYISRTSSGHTPFEFDDIDIHKEIDGVFQQYFSKYDRNVVGLSVTYNADVGNVFDWEVMYGRRSDCIGTWIIWDNRFQRFSFDVTLINL